MRQDTWRRAVPGGDVLKITDSTRLCSLHFTEESFQSTRVVLRTGREEELSRIILKPDAVPTIWPNHHWYQSKFTTSRTTFLATAEAREEADNIIVSSDEKEPVVEDEFNSLDDLVSKLKGNSNNIVVVRDNDRVGSLSISLADRVPEVKYGLKVDPDLAIEAFCGDVEVF